MLIKYSSNNSGGGWWLKDDDWKRLERNGWTVLWAKDHKSKTFIDKKTGRYMGALATEAEKEFESAQDGIREWESLTGQSATDEGCNCCGAPHSFEIGERYYSGEGILELLYENPPSSIREAADRMSKKR